MALRVRKEEEDAKGAKEEDAGGAQSSLLFVPFAFPYLLLSTTLKAREYGSLQKSKIV